MKNNMPSEGLRLGRDSGSVLCDTLKSGLFGRPGGGGKEKGLHTKRDETVDIIKGWAMLTIIIFHCSSSCFPASISSLIGNPWNVPIFFIVGGFFLNPRKMENPISFLKGKIKRLYLPATIVYSLSILLHNLFVYIGWYPLGGSHPSNGLPFAYYGIKEIGIGLIKVLCAGGSGELVMGAMWFLYTLLYAFVAMAIIYWMVCKLCCEDRTRHNLMFIVLSVIAIGSCIMTQKYGLTVNRISTAMTAMFLMWWGMMLHMRIKHNYNGKWLFGFALIVFIHCVIMQRTELKLAKNEYQDLVFLTIGCSAAIIVWKYIAQIIQKTLIGRFIALVGKESLYLMMFHIVGFFICNSLLEYLGVFSNGDKKGLYTFVMGDNWLLLMLYVFFGVTVPLGIMFIYRRLVKCIHEV